MHHALTVILSSQQLRSKEDTMNHEPELQLNSYGQVDVCKGVPAAGILVPKLPMHQDDLRAAQVIFGKALTGFVDNGRRWGRRRWRAVLKGWVIEKNWQAKLEANKNLLAARRTAREEAKWQQKPQRSETAKAGARKRHEKKLLCASPYGQLLLALRDAQTLSDRAKARPGNGVRISDNIGDYCGGEIMVVRAIRRFARANYWRSREAIANDYGVKNLAIDAACHWATEAGTSFGWKVEGGHVPFVVYFDLPTGQVSFHCKVRGQGPNYSGQWDGQVGQSQARIEKAIRRFLPG
jgi:hypothetical protein